MALPPRVELAGKGTTANNDNIVTSTGDGGVKEDIKLRDGRGELEPALRSRRAIITQCVVGQMSMRVVNLHVSIV